MTPRPVEIVGGGLAGLALGIGLRRAGVPVMLFDAGAYPRHRVCGEFITGLDASATARLGLDEVFRALPARSGVAWFGRGAPARRWQLPAPALTVSRHELDARLAGIFRGAGGELRLQQRVDPAAAPPGRVFATGRRPDTRSPWIGLKIHATKLPLVADLEFHVGERAYVGLCRLDADEVNLCGLFRRRAGVEPGRDRAVEAHLRAAGLGALAERLAAAQPQPESFCAVAGIRFGRQSPGAGERVEIGDAFAVTPPFTGNGMAMAFQSAACAVDPLAAWSRGELAWEQAAGLARARLRRRFARRLRWAAALHPFLLTRFGERLSAACDRASLVPMRALFHQVH